MSRNVSCTVNAVCVERLVCLCLCESRYRLVQRRVFQWARAQLTCAKQNKAYEAGTWSNRAGGKTIFAISANATYGMSLRGTKGMSVMKGGNSTAKDCSLRSTASSFFFSGGNSSSRRGL